MQVVLVPTGFSKVMGFTVGKVLSLRVSLCTTRIRGLHSKHTEHNNNSSTATNQLHSTHPKQTWTTLTQSLHCFKQKLQLQKLRW